MMKTLMIVNFAMVFMTYKVKAQNDNDNIHGL